MLQAVSALKGYAIQAEDGLFGTVSDFLFDDRTWKVRWLVVEAGTWLTGRRVLVHPSAIGPADHDRRELAVALTKAQVKDSPGILGDRPVSQQMQTEVHDYHGWDPLWGGVTCGAELYGSALFGAGIGAIASPAATAAPYFADGAVRGTERPMHDFNAGDPHLRSIAEVTGYHVHATDGTIGHVENFLVEGAGWGVRYLVIDTANWWVGQHVLISPYAVREVEWSDHRIRLDIARDQVKSSPSWNPADKINGEFERRLHTHYNRPG